MYRYRDNTGTTRTSLSAMRHLSKIGKVTSIRGYRYKAKGISQEAVLVSGENGSCRFGGFLWGYAGEGPRGTVELLKHLGLPEYAANEVAFESLRREHDELGVDWRIDFYNGYAVASMFIQGGTRTTRIEFSKAA